MSQQFNVRRGSKQSGPFSLAELKKARDTGQLRGTDEVYEDGAGVWFPASQFFRSESEVEPEDVDDFTSVADDVSEDDIDESVGNDFSTATTNVSRSLRKKSRGMMYPQLKQHLKGAENGVYLLHGVISSQIDLVDPL